MLLEIILGIALFTVIIMALVAIILVARSRLIPSGLVHIKISNAPEKSFDTACGAKLLASLADADIFLSSSCGGTGICGQCRVKVLSGGGIILPTEKNLINKKDAADDYRLACQVTVHQSMMLELPEEVFTVKRWDCEVVSNHNVATFIKELVLHLPEGEEIDFEPGSYVLLEAPSYHIKYSEIDVDERYRKEWDEFDLWKLESYTKEPVKRAYTMANYPGEGKEIKFNIRIALPPLSSKGVPPGKISSYLFSLKTGDRVTLSGPYGEFFPRYTGTEMIYVGGGSGMAPLRSHINYLLKEEGDKRKISYWYGARSLDEIFYMEEFDNLKSTFENFSWHIALSDPKPEDNWKGDVGFIHQVLYDRYLKNHATPEDCEYYICGPPMMMDAIINMLKELGVEEENIFFDDFSA